MKELPFHSTTLVAIVKGVKDSLQCRSKCLCSKADLQKTAPTTSMMVEGVKNHTVSWRHGTKPKRATASKIIIGYFGKEGRLKT